MSSPNHSNSLTYFTSLPISEKMTGVVGEDMEEHLVSPNDRSADQEMSQKLSIFIFWGGLKANILI